MQGSPFESGLSDTPEIVTSQPSDNLTFGFDDWEDHQVVWAPGMSYKDDQDIVLWWHGENGDRLPVVARGDLMVVTGAQKTRKSLLIQSMIMSNYIQDDTVTLGFRMDLSGDPIIYYDTEQPLRRVRKNMERFHNIIKATSHVPNYYVFSTKAMSAKKRLEFITYTIKQVQDKTGRNPGFIGLDQIADLLPARDVNDQYGVDVVLEHITMWDELVQGKAVIAPVIHTNRGGQNTNGKMGVILDQKTDCSFLVNIEKGTWISKVTNKESRERRIPDFEFRQDMDGSPRLLSVGDPDSMSHI